MASNIIESSIECCSILPSDIAAVQVVRKADSIRQIPPHDVVIYLLRLHPSPALFKSYEIEVSRRRRERTTGKRRDSYTRRCLGCRGVKSPTSNLACERERQTSNIEQQFNAGPFASRAERG
ncbi:hypothetical protein, variant [Phialophora macrospora]|uniref:Uncharacterized protein n=1 Tax=Phialophora macrospora TaxID=1851006 RepID=A0A0D2EDA8_9EURO|nr:hypothetical protein PV04_00483 [Phialophora macrospora]KIW72278.1 hypothetical protein, variant [Phialophora macrospora]